MSIVQKALWFVDTNTRGLISLDEVAGACDVSPFHLTRAFANTTGLSLMRYVRARRLSAAARLLAAGAQDILSLAFDAGYGSHEAFTRAFREHFGLTPEQVRAQGHLDNLQLQEAYVMTRTTVPELAPPRFETTKPRILGGLVERFDCQAPQGIPELWQRFGAHLGHIPGQVGPVAYGVSYNFDKSDNFDYLCAVELSSTHDLPKGFKTLAIPAQRYVVFTNTDHVSAIRQTISAIWENWFPTSGQKAVEGPMLERYGPEFNPLTGMGGFEIWIPIEG